MPQAGSCSVHKGTVVVTIVPPVIAAVVVFCHIGTLRYLSCNVYYVILSNNNSIL